MSLIRDIVFEYLFYIALLPLRIMFAFVNYTAIEDKMRAPLEMYNVLDVTKCYTMPSTTALIVHLFVALPIVHMFMLFVTIPLICLIHFLNATRSLVLVVAFALHGSSAVIAVC